MSMKRYKPEQIITLLGQIEVEIATGRPLPKPASPPNGQNVNRLKRPRHRFRPVSL